MAILRGVNQLADVVNITLGPNGRNVALNKKFGSPTITKDGVTIAKAFELKDSLENMSWTRKAVRLGRVRRVSLTHPRPRPRPSAHVRRAHRVCPRIRRCNE